MPGMLVLRIFLSLSESAFFPLAIYYLTTIYRRVELARRLAIFYAVSNIANACSGLLAFGLFRVKDTHLYSWKYLFLVEGSLTFLFPIFAFYLPPNASSSRFLNEKEKKLASHRIHIQVVLVRGGRNQGVEKYREMGTEYYNIHSYVGHSE